MEIIKIMDKQATEYKRKTGEHMDEILMATVIGGVMDEETGKEVRRRDIPRTFKAIKAYVMEEIQATEDAKFVLPKMVLPPAQSWAKGKSDPMELGALAEGAPEQPVEPGAAHGDGGAGDGNPDLDALSKGKGKGKGKGKASPCTRCGGRGHSAAQCPSPAQGMGSHECRYCGGKGHFARDHPGYRRKKRCRKP